MLLVKLHTECLFRSLTPGMSNSNCDVCLVNPTNYYIRENATGTVQSTWEVKQAAVKLSHSSILFLLFLFLICIPFLFLCICFLLCEAL